MFSFPIQQAVSQYAQQFAGHTKVLINQRNRKVAGSSSVRPRTVLFKSERLLGLAVHKRRGPDSTVGECFGDLSLIEELAALTTVDRSIAISSAGLLHFSHANARESVPIAVSMIGFATFSASSPFANITTPNFLAGSAITKALKSPLSPQCQSMTLLCSR